MRKQFDIKYRPQIESGEYKVETTKGQSVRIICWDRSTTYWKIIGLVLSPDGRTENPFTYDVNGKESDGCLHNHELDLFIVTPEEELTEFEKELESFYNHHLQVCTYDNQGTVEDSLHDGASKLLAIARKKLEQEIKAEALKDLPRWKKIGRGNNYSSETEFTINGRYLEMNDTLNNVYEVSLSELEKLPKEDEK